MYGAILLYSVFTVFKIGLNIHMNSMEIVLYFIQSIVLFVLGILIIMLSTKSDGIGRFSFSSLNFLIRLYNLCHSLHSLVYPPGC